MSRPRSAVLVALLLATYAALALGFALHASPTWDEVPTFGQGLYLAREGRWDIPGTINHPPLSWYLQSLPLALAGIEEGDAWRYQRMPADPHMRLIWRGVYDVTRGWALLDRNLARHPIDRLLLLTRLPTLLLGLLTAWVLHRWSTRLHGAAGGRLTLALFCLSPSYIAHGALATTDMSMMLFTTAAAWAVWRAWDDFHPARALAAGALLGLACLSKYTALLLVAPFTGLLAAGALTATGPRRHGAPPTSRAQAAVRAAALLLLLAAAATATIAAGYQGDIAAFKDGVVYQQINVRHGQIGFLAGELQMNGWWYYYPVVLAIKTPIPELLLAALGIFFWLRRERLSMAQLFATVPFLFLLAFFMYKRLPVGLRHILPVYPALLIAAGAILAGGGRRRRLVALALTAALAVGTLRIHPHELSFFNSLAGGPEGGTDYLLDSNSDWGQDLKDLGDWMRARGVETIQLGYFGSADPAHYGIDYLPLPSFALRRQPDPQMPWPPSGLVAVSASCYWGLPWPDNNPYAFLHRLRPIGRAGYSILIFDVP